MSILIKKEIIELAQYKNLLGKDYDLGNFEGCSYDLRIGSIFLNEIKKVNWWESDPIQDYKIISKSHQDESVVSLGPSEIVTMLTLEEVELPNDICGTVFPINRNSSTGLLILNPGHIDPGYKGPISICAINLSNQTISLNIGEKIFTIIFEKLPKETDGYKNMNENLSRRDKEKDFYARRASKLSKSIYNLLTAEKYRPFLKNQIKEVINRRIILYITIIGVIIGLFANLDKILDSGSKTSINIQAEDTLKTRINLLIREELKKIQNDSLSDKNKKSIKYD